MPTRRLKRRADGAPVYRFDRVAGSPPVELMRIGAPLSHAEHAHDFLALAYFERGGGTFVSGPAEGEINAGDVCVIAPGECVGARGALQGWLTFFPPDAVSGAPVLEWSSHPLLFAFTGRERRFVVAPEDRPAWSARFEALDRELSDRRAGHADAALAHLTLLLVDVARLAGEQRFAADPLLSAVLTLIEERYAEPLSLHDVADALALTPGHLTTVMRRRTGRTVLEWITERRMAEARRLLEETDLPAATVGRAAGYPDAGYFARVFRRAHGTTPLAWRRATRR